MNRILLTLDGFTLLLSLLGLALPASAPLRFLLPHFEASLGGLLLGSGVLWAQLRDAAGKSIPVKLLALIGLLLLGISTERMLVSSVTGWFNSRLSHADLFLVAPLAITFLLTALDRLATPQPQTAPQHSRRAGWRARQPQASAAHLHPALHL